MPLLGCILCAPWEVTALEWCWQESGIPSLDAAKAGGRGVREKVPVVRECWMWCWRTPGTPWLDEKCCVRWVRGGKQEGVPVPAVPAEPREVAWGRTEVQRGNWIFPRQPAGLAGSAIAGIMHFPRPYSCISCFPLLTLCTLGISHALKYPH